MTTPQMWGTYLRHRSTPVSRPCWRWSLGLCWRWRFCGSAFCLGRVSVTSRRKSLPGATWVSDRCGSPPRCFRWPCPPCANASCTTPWRSKRKTGKKKKITDVKFYNDSSQLQPEEDTGHVFRAKFRIVKHIKAHFNFRHDPIKNLNFLGKKMFSASKVCFSDFSNVYTYNFDLILNCMYSTLCISAISQCTHYITPYVFHDETTDWFNQKQSKNVFQF